ATARGGGGGGAGVGGGGGGGGAAGRRVAPRTSTGKSLGPSESGCPWRTCTACRSCRSGAAPGCLRPARCSRRSPPRRAIQLPRRLQLRLPDSWRLRRPPRVRQPERSEEHTSELQSPDHLVCRLLLEKKKM